MVGAVLTAGLHTAALRSTSTDIRWEADVAMEGRKPLANVDGRRRLRMRGVTVAVRGTPNLDDWVAYIANGTKSRKTILADHASERKVKNLMTRLQTMSKKEIEKLAKG